jgi:hypothetical protein
MVVVTRLACVFVILCEKVGTIPQQSTDFSVLEHTTQLLLRTRMPYNRFDPQYGINTHKKAPNAM